jgi:hypothetical protein
MSLPTASLVTMGMGTLLATSVRAQEAPPAGEDAPSAATEPAAADDIPEATVEAPSTVETTQAETETAEESSDSEETEEIEEIEETDVEADEESSDDEEPADEEATVEEGDDDTTVVETEKDDKTDEKPVEETADEPDDEEESPPPPKKKIIGSTAQVQEMQSGIVFNARIDTGAETCSLHVESLRVEDEDPDDMQANLGKTAFFEVKNRQGETHVCEAKIVSVVRIKNAVGIDRRYKVVLTFGAMGVRKKVRVSLNDRSDMQYPVLIGRNFLRGDFLVDVSQGQQD